MPPGTTPPPPIGQPKRSFLASWNRLTARANIIASITLLFAFLFIGGGVAGFYLNRKITPPPAAPKTAISTLSAEDIAKLNNIGSNLGSSGQTLNISADALFRGKADIGGNLTVGGRFNANGPVTLSQLNITGTSAVSGLNVGSNLAVTGTTSLQQSLTVGQLATFNGGINVGGNSSLNNVNANTLAVRNISISGPLTIAHLGTQGPAPVFVAGTAVGTGGTASVSGNDTAGTVNFNTGSNPPAGVLGTITFRAPYTSTVHVLLSPLTGSAASARAYVTRNGGGFQIHTDTPPPAGALLSFDYFVTQ